MNKRYNHESNKGKAYQLQEAFENTKFCIFSDNDLHQKINYHRPSRRQYHDNNNPNFYALINLQMKIFSNNM